LEQIIGNAVPVNLAKFVGDCIKEYINDPNRKEKVNHYTGILDFGNE
jgi:hypothetical protein